MFRNIISAHRLRVFITGVLIFCALQVTAKSDPVVVTQLSGTALTANATTPWIEVADYANSSVVETEHSVLGVVMLEVQEKNYFIPADFTADVPITIEYITLSGDARQVVQTFTVDYKKATGTKFKAKDYFSLKGIRKIKLTVGTPNYHGATWAVNNVLTLKAELRAVRDYVFNPAATVTVTKAPVENADANGLYDEIEVTWNYGITYQAYTHYDIEWAWIDKKAADRYFDNGNTSLFNTEAIFKDNASRVTVNASKSDYNIPLFYDGSGYLVYRIRPVQVKENGIVVNGTWSGGATLSITSHQVFSYNGHQDNMNWQASTTFAEDGKRKTVVQYFDGSLRARQTVTKDNQTQNVIVAESFYDYQGRPVIQVLPAPTLGKVISYARNFNQFMGNAAYPKDLYDFAAPTELCIKGAPPLNKNSGAAQYYSNQNPEVGSNPPVPADPLAKFIPDANGYAYTETRYTPDNTGRIAVQGGVGELHQIGGTNSKATRYYYGSADQAELDALFGTEVGNESHYFKNMVRDANGQYSISYVDMHGRTIATALAGTPPQKLQGLESSNPNNFPTITKNILNSATNIVKERSIEATKTLVVPFRTEYTFNYSLSPEEFKLANCNGNQVCYDCLYDLEITIRNQCGDYVQTYTKTGINAAACNSTDPFTWSATYILDEGEYDITKRLSINEESFNKHKADFLLNNTCRDLQYYITEVYNAMVNMNPNCAPTCATCTTAVGTYANFRSGFLAKVNFTGMVSTDLEASITEAYNQALKDCEALCTPSFNKLAEIRASMLADLVPITGQYAQLPVGNNTMPVNSIFGTLPAISNAYKQVNTPYNSSPDVFATNFENDWANTLLPYHPEYCKLNKAETLLKTSYDFDNLMQSVETFAAAQQKGWISANLVNIDPFFAGPGNGTYKSQMQNFVNVDLSQGFSMWQIAFATVFCQNIDNVSSCAGAAQKTPAYTLNNCTADWDYFWRSFRSMYLTKRDQLISNYLENACPNQPPVAQYLAQKYRLHFNGYQQFLTIQDYLEQNRNILSAGSNPNQTLPEQDQAATDVHNALIDEYHTNCDSYIPAWRETLEKCPQIQNISNVTTRNQVIQDILTGFKQVCYESADENHPFGASNKPGGSSFEQVMQNVFSQYQLTINNACNPYMIEWPKPYDKQPAMGSPDVLTPKNNQCVCEKISQINQAKKNVGFGGTLSDFIQYQYGTFIRQGTLDTLIMGCNNVYPCNYLKEPISLPPVLQCTTPLEVCISCEEYAAYKDQFKQQFPQLEAPYINPADEAQVNANKLFAQFINYRTGFGKTWNEYVDFQLACATYNDNNPFPCETLTAFLNNYLSTYNGPTYGQQCKLAFVQAFNAHFNTFYTFSDIMALYVRNCGQMPAICQPTIDCNKFKEIIALFYAQQGDDIAAGGTQCQQNFVAFFNQYFGTTIHTWESINELYAGVCPGTLDVCTPLSCTRLQLALTAYQQSITTTEWTRTDCMERFAAFFNQYFGSSYHIEEITQLYTNCGILLTVCTPPYTCEQLDQIIANYNNGAYTCTIQHTNERIQCQLCFAAYFNQVNNTSFTYTEIAAFYRNICNKDLTVCADEFGCDNLNNWLNDFREYMQQNPTLNCKTQFVAFMNERLGLTYTYDQLIQLFIYYCGVTPSVCNTVFITSCEQLETVSNAFLELYPTPQELLGGNCQQTFVNYFNGVFGTDYTYTEIMELYTRLCGTTPNVCGTSNCENLTGILNNYQQQYGNLNLPRNLCRDHFVWFVNSQLEPLFPLSWADVVAQYQACGITLPICGPVSQVDICTNMGVIVTMFNHLNQSTGDCRLDFARFYNTYFGTLLTYDQIKNSLATTICELDLDGYLNCGEIVERPTIVITDEPPNTEPDYVYPPRLCGLNYPIFPPVEVVKDDPCKDIHNFTLYSATEKLAEYRQSIKDQFEREYLAKCLAAKDIEVFTVTHKVAEYHYTLYYYDQAGNLVKTVPPQGVKADFSTTWRTTVNTARSNNTSATPAHTMVTNYRYNGLNQVIAQSTPDGGDSRFWYDRLGRLVVSQNAKQKKNNNFSYTLYDDLGRIKEVGEKQKGSGSVMDQALSQHKDNLNAWLTTDGNPRREITRTIYDDAYAALCNNSGNPIANLLCQTNLRNRVSYTMVIPEETGAPPAVTIGGWSSATFYSYDIHGNVGELLQDYREGGMAQNNQYKKIEYRYDLVSGKVNEVWYQADKPDAFYHHYEYDDENKLTEVSTSKDRIVWDRDAVYTYYQHGPLGRMLLGENQVQGIDYAYTLHGWLKGVNGTHTDMGEDGTATSGNANVARDAYSYSLNYYEGDYSNIGNTGNFQSILNPLGSNAKQLYNGNIAAMAVNIPKLGDARVYNYGYDQLNRLVSMDAYSGLTSGTSTFTPVLLNDYKERISYDANGNILTYLRNGNGTNTAMDNLTYHYYYQSTQLDAGGNRTWKTYQPGQAGNTAPADLYAYSNRLAHVKDAVAPGPNEDIDDQADKNYEYDEIGNLVKDANGNNPITIEWNVYGKIKSVRKSIGTAPGSYSDYTEYTYDAAGNRISKVYYPAGMGAAITSTFYVRDASGNVMAVYQKVEQYNPETVTMKQTEVHLYGSSRLGILNRDVDVSSTAPDNSVYAEGATNDKGYRLNFERGNKFFELSNHLGNVLVTITDRVIQYQYAGSTAMYYEADVTSANDYYPFGMVMPDRKYTANTGYRYGFNGKEKDDDISKTTSYDYGFRIYNPALGKFLSVDPLQEKYPNLTVYQFASNSPIAHIDLDGLEKFHYTYTIDVNGNPKLELTSIEHFSEWKWKPKKGGTWLGFQLWEKVKDPRKEYIVSYSWDTYAVVDALAVQYKATVSHTYSSDPNSMSIDCVSSDISDEAEDYMNNMAIRQGIAGGFGSRSRPGIPRFGKKKVQSEAPAASTNGGTSKQQAAATGKTLTENETSGITLKISTPQVGKTFKTYGTKIEDGKVSMVTTNGPANTNGRFDFVITNDGKLLIGTGHFNLSGGASSVKAAGQLKIVNGKVKEIDNSSGHYQPNIDQGKQAVKLLQNMGVNTTGARVSLYNLDGTLNKTYINK